MNITKKDIGDVMEGILSRAQEELKSMTQEDLKTRWYFQYDHSRSKEWNIYKFADMLDLYKRQCRRWEEFHNGSCCVVERVRDTYLMPRIQQFLVDFEGDHVE